MNWDCEKEVLYFLLNFVVEILDYKIVLECSFVDDKESLCM